MKAIVSLEQRFYIYNDEWYTTGAFNEDFWNRYLDVFNEVLIVARAMEIEELRQGLIKVTGEKVRAFALPHYVGIKEALKMRSMTKKKLQRLVTHEKGAYVLRVGSPIADLLAPMLKKQKMPYAVEVVGDPWDVFAPGAIKHPLRPLLRVYFANRLKLQCAGAAFASYVTEFALQKRYPPKTAIATTHASSIDLGSEHFYKREVPEGKRIKKFLYVGTLEQLQKAPDVLIKAFSKALKQNPNIQLGLIGDGRERPNLEKLVRDLGITDNVTFHGHFPGPDDVRRVLKNVDAFVLPSRGEGLPRAMIEAMACSLVCIGSDIGGIREQIPKEWIAPVGSVDSLAHLIIKASKLNEEQIIDITARNYKAAKSYTREKVGKRRGEFYQKFKKHLEETV